jgi:hypothetical protein
LSVLSNTGKAYFSTSAHNKGKRRFLLFFIFQPANYGKFPQPNIKISLPHPQRPAFILGKRLIGLVNRNLPYQK